jgi:hypothetical protein
MAASRPQPMLLGWMQQLHLLVWVYSQQRGL